jgi:cytochrome P450
VSDTAATIQVPAFLRRALGRRTPRRLSFDTVASAGIGRNAFFLLHPDDVRHVLVDHAANYEKSAYLTSEAGRARAGRGLLTSVGDAHRRKRRTLQPVFRPAVVQRFSQTIAAAVDAHLDRWEDGREVDLVEEMATLTRGNLLRVLLGDGFADEGGALSRAIGERRRYTEYVYYSRLPFHTRLPTPTLRAGRRARRTILERMDAEIARHRQGRTANSGEDFLDLLLALRDPEGAPLADAEIRDELLTLTSTGYETLGEALAWTLHLLGVHPDRRDRVVAEIDGATARRAEGGAEPLPLLRAALSEAMRLYPPTWIFERVPTAADRLPSGAEVAAGTGLLLCTWILHRHPRFFPEPEVFRPERFENGTPAEIRHVYFPFGDGPHKCIGEHYALMQATDVLAKVLAAFDFEPVAGHAVAPRAGITLTAGDGIRVRVRARKR